MHADSPVSDSPVSATDPPAPVPGRLYTRAAVEAAVNRAADDVIEAAELPDTGARDAVNLTVNAALSYLDDAGGMDLAGVVEANYDVDLAEVLTWINS